MLKIPGADHPGVKEVQVESKSDFVGSLVIGLEGIEPDIVGVSNSDAMSKVEFCHQRHRFLCTVRKPKEELLPDKKAEVQVHLGGGILNELRQ
jgi:hypothetical protein